MTLHRFIALAGTGNQPGAFQDADTASTIFDVTCILQGKGNVPGCVEIRSAGVLSF